MIKIDRNIRIPESGTPHAKYPWRSMNVGDSFFTMNVRIRMQTSNAGKRYQRKFATRQDKTHGGVRVWRIA